MSMNIAPTIPQVVVNAAAPTTEALAKANADKQVIPATVQTEPYAPQKSREQEARNPLNNEDPGTYDDIRSNTLNNKIIPEDEQQSEEQNAKQQQGSEEDPSSSDDSQEQKEQKEQAENKQETAEKQQESKEQRVVDQLESRDREVRAHEQAHAAVGGSLAGSPSYEYQTGPDGKKYAVGGEVSIDVSKANDAEATIRKMQTVRAAALAPAEPSSQDRKVAAQASRNIAEARADLITESSNLQGSEKTESRPDIQVDKNQQPEDTEQTEHSKQLENQEAVAGSNASSPATAFAASSSSNKELSVLEQPINKKELASRFISKDNDDRTAQVVSQKYASSSIQTQNYFNAVA